MTAITIPYIVKDAKTGNIRMRIDVNQGPVQDLVLLITVALQPDGTYRGRCDPEDALVEIAGGVMGGSEKKLRSG